jgi:hypothetical protein
MMSEVIFLVLGIWVGVGWAFSNVTEYQFAKAQELCKANGGIEGYRSPSVGYSTITCKNGARFTVNRKDEP